MQKPLMNDDGEARELTEDDLINAMSMRLRHPTIPKHVRGVQKTPKKVHLSIRLSPEVINHFKAKGKGWQTQIDEVLKDYIAHQHSH